MLGAIAETVTVSVPAGGYTDSFTGEQLGAGAPTTYTPSVIWLGAPSRKLAVDGSSGRPFGMVQAGDAQLLYQAAGVAAPLDWTALAQAGVLVTRGGHTYAVLEVTSDPLHAGDQLITLALRRGGV